MFGKKEKRFSVKEMESYGGSGTIRIIVDTKTGVNYIMTEGVGGSSITPYYNIFRFKARQPAVSFSALLPKLLEWEGDGLTLTPKD